MCCCMRDTASMAASVLKGLTTNEAAPLRQPAEETWSEEDDMSDGFFLQAGTLLKRQPGSRPNILCAIPIDPRAAPSNMCTTHGAADQYASVLS